MKGIFVRLTNLRRILYTGYNKQLERSFFGFMCGVVEKRLRLV